MKHCVHYNMDEPWKQHVWWKKPDTKGHITCQSVCTKLQLRHTDRWEQARASRPGSGTGWGLRRLRLGLGWGGDRGGSTWVREGVGTSEAPPGSGKEWGPRRLRLGQGRSGDRQGSAWGPRRLSLGQGAGGDSYGCVDLLTLMQLRLRH